MLVGLNVPTKLRKSIIGGGGGCPPPPSGYANGLISTVLAPAHRALPKCPIGQSAPGYAYSQCIKRCIAKMSWISILIPQFIFVCVCGGGGVVKMQVLPPPPPPPPHLKKGRGIYGLSIYFPCRATKISHAGYIKRFNL